MKYLGNEKKYLEAVLNSQNWSSTSGSWTSLLEKEFAKKFQAKYAIAFNSGTSTMHAALLAAGIKPGDEVISPALTVIMNTATTIHANVVPIYADICPDTFTIDPQDIERKITPKTIAIMVVSIYGLPCDMDPIMQLANKYNLFVLEDNAECFLSTYKDNMTGTIGNMASYSFENSKHMSCGEGGMLITNDERLALIATAYPGTEMWTVVKQKLHKHFDLEFDKYGEPICDDNFRRYVLELDDATKVLNDKNGNPVNFSEMPLDIFLQAREYIDNNQVEKILDM